MKLFNATKISVDNNDFLESTDKEEKRESSLNSNKTTTESRKGTIDTHVTTKSL